MSRYRKVVWNEGMLLTPHHFQQWDNYYEELLSSRFASAAPYEWGVLDFQANNEAIANGNFDLIRCRAVMPAPSPTYQCRRQAVCEGPGA